MKILAVVVLFLGLSFLTVQAFSFWEQQRVLGEELAELQIKLDKAEVARDQLKAQLIGYDTPENVEKKVREQFNYRRPDEKMLIIIPSRESASSTVR